MIPGRNPIWVQFVSHKLLRLLTPYLVAIVGIWMILRTIMLLGAAPLSAQASVIAAMGLVGLWIFRANGRIAPRIRRAATEGVLLQKAVFVAGLNGMRGRWQVWDV